MDDCDFVFIVPVIPETDMYYVRVRKGWQEVVLYAGDDPNEATRIYDEHRGQYDAMSWSVRRPGEHLEL